MRIAQHPRGRLSLFWTITTFGTPVDVTVAELALETFFPADADTAARLHEMAEPADRAPAVSDSRGAPRGRPPRRTSGTPAHP